MSPTLPARSPDAHDLADVGERVRCDRARLLRPLREDRLEPLLVRADLGVALAHRGEHADDGLGHRLNCGKQLIAVENVRGGISKKSMVNNDATPAIEVDPETYDVRADGELLVCEPAEVLPMAQRYFLF